MFVSSFVEKFIDTLTNIELNAIAQMKQTGEPIVLTVNGKAEVAVQDAKSYQQLLEKIENLEAISQASH